MNPSVAASVLALALFVPAPQAASQDRIASEAPVAAGVSVANDPAVRDALARLDAWLDGQRYRFDLPGFAVGLVHDQQLLWSKGYGYADVAQRIPSTDQTLYRIASISKTFAATAVVQLAERGKLSLDDPVSRHLTWFVPKDSTPRSPVRVWNLLSHTGGLQRESPGSDWDALLSPGAVSLASATSDTPLVLQPQTRLAYSNYGYAVAGQLVEQVSGMEQIEIALNRAEMARFGINIADVNEVIETAIAGKEATRVVDGQMRIATVVRFHASARSDIPVIERLIVRGPAGEQIPAY